MLDIPRFNKVVKIRFQTIGLKHYAAAVPLGSVTPTADTMRLGHRFRVGIGYFKPMYDLSRVAVYIAIDFVILNSAIMNSCFIFGEHVN